MRLAFEESAPVGRKEFMRSDSDNWRTLREEQEEDDTGEPGGSWRLTGSRRDGIHTKNPFGIDFNSG